jgi:hypothetical protein
MGFDPGGDFDAGNAWLGRANRAGASAELSVHPIAGGFHFTFVTAGGLDFGSAGREFDCGYTAANCSLYCGRAS